MNEQVLRERDAIRALVELLEQAQRVAFMHSEAGMPFQPPLKRLLGKRTRTSKALS